MLLVANRELDSSLRPKAGASDLVQETFVEAQKDFRRRFSGTSEQEFYAWLTQILINRVRNHARRYRGTLKRDVTSELPLDVVALGKTPPLAARDPSPSAFVLAVEEEQQVREAMARLPAHYQRVLFLRNWERRSFGEIAEELQRSEGAARKLWLRAVRQLQQELSRVR